MSKQRHKKVIRPEKCPCCGSPVVLRSADGIYKSNPHHVQLYVCSKYPVCDAYVRVIPGTTIPLGTMADKQLRYLRKRAHQYFDQLYTTGIMTKNRRMLGWPMCFSYPLNRSILDILVTTIANRSFVRHRKSYRKTNIA